MGEIVVTISQGPQEGPLWCWNVLYPDSIDANMLVVLVDYSFARCCLWGKLGERKMGSLCLLFLITTCKAIMISQ